MRSADELAAPLAAATVVAIGPGLGTGAWSRALFDAALTCAKPLVMDADALNLLAVTGQRVPGEHHPDAAPGRSGAIA